MMKLQIQPLYASRAEYEQLAQAEGLFFEALELTEPWTSRTEEMLSWYRNSGMLRSLHGAFIDVNPASSDPEIRSLSCRRMEESCRLADELGAENVVFHSACFPNLRGYYLELYLSRSAECYRDLLERWPKLHLYLENSQDLDPDPLLKLIDAVNDPRFRVCLDLGHAACSRVPVREWFSRLGSRIGYLHLSDNDGLFDDHMALGSGKLDLEEASSLAAELPGDLPATLEVGGLEGIRRSLQYLKTHRLFGMEPKVGEMTDIRTLAKAGEAPQSMAAAYGDLMRGMSDGVMLIDLNGSVSFVNPTAERILECSAKKLVGQPFAAFFSGEEGENDELGDLFIEAVMTGKPIQKTIVCRTGTEKKRLSLYGSFLYENGKKKGMNLVFSELGERRNPPENPASSYQNLIRKMDEGMMIVRFDSTVLLLNKVGEQILGKTADKYVGKSFFNFLADEEEDNDDFIDMFINATRFKEKVRRTVEYRVGGVTKKLLATSSYLFEKGERVGAILVFSDVTEIERQEDQKAAGEIRRLEERNKLLAETFSRFLSDDIVRQLLDTPDGLALGGSKKLLTVLMSDLRGFTALSERMPAQDLLTMLNHYLGEMTEIIQSCRGTIIEFIGDGIMAIFGAPKPSEKHAEEAVTAAVRMQARMPEINRWNCENGFPTLEMGIGINTGEMIVGNIGSEKRTKYGVTGKEVNLAGRIESYTVGGQILVPETTVRLLSVPLTVASSMEVKPKGVDAPITLSQITGIGDESCAEGPQKAAVRPLRIPTEVSFLNIKDKHVGDRPEEGRFLALSADEALLATDSELQTFDNLQLDIGAKLFAKVTGREEGCWQLTFTSRPALFEEWLAKQPFV